MTNSVEHLKSALADRYAIERELGAGGMATVYLAQDIKHDRKVAVKVLRPELAAVLGTERFLNEIKITANLSHPHILPLLDSGRADGRTVGQADSGSPAEFLFYVMPYVDGESLREKLNREKQVSIEESIKITESIASALDYAHRQNVIHRDIKPENILLHDGQPVVADFGISLAVTAAGGTRLTETGLSLGTPQYMSPEQATGDREVDGRSDIYSLACVLYEMLAGEPPHTGPTVQAVIAKVVTAHPRPIAELRDTVPVHVAAAIHKALAKLQADRFGSVGEFSGVLSGQVAIDAATVHTAVTDDTRRAGGENIGTKLPWVVAAIAVFIAIAATTWSVLDPGRASTAITQHLNIQLPDSAPMVFIGEATFGMGEGALDLSPDGSHLVYVGEAEIGTRLYLKEMTGFEIRPLPGTEGAYGPFFSPDGDWVAFFVEDQLRKVSVTDGVVVPIADQLEDAYGGTWGEDDRIFLVLNEGRRFGMVSADGGSVSFSPALPGDALAYPEWLPGGEWVLLTCTWPAYHICATSPSTGEMVSLQSGGPAVHVDEAQDLLVGSSPHFVPPSLLVYSAPTTNQVMGVHLDPRSLETRGTPTILMSDVRRENYWGEIHLAVSDDGTVVFASGSNRDVGEFVWADANGVTESLPFPPESYGSFAISPDGRRVVVTVQNVAGSVEYWFLDLETGTVDEWAGDITTRGEPKWGPDSDWIASVVSTHPEHTMLRISNSDMGRADTLYSGPVGVWPEQFLGGDSVLVWLPGDAARPNDAYQTILSFSELTALESGDGVPARMVDVPGYHNFARVSPDGTWYTFGNALERSPYQVYAVPLSEIDARPPQRISTGGGLQNEWSPDGGGFYYRDGTRWYWVELNGSGSDPFAEPELLLEGEFLEVVGSSFAVHPDGDRLLLLQGAPERATHSLRVITNWVAEVERQLDGR